MAKLPPPGKAKAGSRRDKHKSKPPKKYIKEPRDIPPKWLEPPPKPATVLTEPKVKSKWVLVDDKIVKGYQSEDEDGELVFRRIRYPCRRFVLEDVLAAPPVRCTIVYTHFSQTAREPGCLAGCESIVSHSRSGCPEKWRPAREAFQGGRKWKYTSPEGVEREMDEREFPAWARRRLGTTMAAILLYLSVKTD